MTTRSVPVLVVVATYAVAPALGTVHLLAGHHAVCAEHGELTHAGHSDSPVHPGGAGVGRAAVDTPTSASHEHCQVADHRTVPAASIESRDQVTGRSSLARTAAVAARAPEERDAIRTAPKHSPPVV